MCICRGAKNKASSKLKETAYNLGCNAIIGVNYNYFRIGTHGLGGLHLDTSFFCPSIICVTATGTAVLIEKKQ